MDPLVSVIIPSYKAAPYIRQTVQSVLEQTYGNTEVIVMNDGSPDNLGEIVQQMQQEDSRIQYHYKPNSGVSDTRNKGIALAKGQYVAFLDADDVWKPENLEKKIRALQQTGKKWVFSDLDHIDGNGHPMHVEKNNFRPYNILDNLLLWEGDVVPGPCSNIVVSRDLLGDDVRFDTRISSPADRDICLQLAAREEPYYIDEKLWLYRLHGQSMTSLNYKVVDEMVYLYRKADERKWFSSRKVRRKALSNINLIMAGICLSFPSQRKRMPLFLMKACWYSPVNVWQKKILPIFKRSNTQNT
ncbi:MAG: glycosyltransferase family 2 protein [Chitinophagaceae bacterium]|nr:glycosyltransferase family 2 protein [Chitinophagaceae bacterium]